jgi:hypothetical protein
LGNVSQPEANWQKGLESQVSHLSGKLSALCSEMKELHQLLFVDDEDGKRPNFKHDRLGLGVKDASIVTKIAQMYVPELQTSTPNTVEKMVAPLEETASQEPMKTPEPFGSPLSGQFVNGSPEPTSQGEIQTSDVMQMSKGDAPVRRKRGATIVPQVRSPTTSRNTRARQELTPIRKSKRLQKQLS